MPRFDVNNLSPESLVTAYWDTVTRLREGVERIPLEDLSRRQNFVVNQQTKLSAIVDGLLEASASANADAMFAIGDAYQNGNGVARSRVQSMRWFRKAAEAGNTTSMVRLSVALRHPEQHGNRSEAVQWLLNAAARGDSRAMASLGYALSEETGSQPDFEQAVSWHKKAVKAGHRHSMLHVGQIYVRHLNSPREALKWFLRAAKDNQESAYIELAMLYDQRGTPVHDPVNAVKWYKVVADTSRYCKPRAMLALAKHCRDGDGTARDFAAASKWLHQVMQSTGKSSPQHREAAKLLKSIEKKSSSQT